MRMIQITIRWLLAAIFAWAAYAKAVEAMPKGEPITIFDQWAYSNAIRYSLIAGEAILAFWLLSGYKPSLAGIVVIIALSGFSGILVTEIGKDRPKPCGCMGAEAAANLDPETIRHGLEASLARNVCLMAGAAWLFMAGNPKLNTRRLPGEGAGPSPSEGEIQQIHA